MSERTEYAPGTPSWIDIGSPDLDTTHRFYTGLFGWTTQAAGPVEETGGYGFYLSDGKMVAGYGPAMDPSGGVWWTSYVSVDDADAAVARAQAAGGTVVVPAMDVLDSGRMAILADPGGAVFALWEPRQHPGAQLVNEPGAWCWNELMTRDLAGARRFYAEVFGWTDTNGEGAPYAEFHVGDAAVAGGMDIPPTMPAQVPPHWNIYVAVADLDAAIARVPELGGQVRQGAFDTPAGRAAIIGGPHHEGLSIIQLAVTA